MSMVGADIAALREFASSLRYRRQEVDATRQHLTAVVENLPWAGDDHDRFVGEWRRVHAPGIAQMVDELATAAREASDHADRQEHASRRRV